MKQVIRLYDKTIYGSSKNKLTCAKCSEVFCRNGNKKKALVNVNSDNCEESKHRELENPTCSFWNSLPIKTHYNTTWKVNHQIINTKGPNLKLKILGKRNNETPTLL